VSRRAQIELGEAEIKALLEIERVAGDLQHRTARMAATRCRSGSSPAKEEVWIWTYAKSQKVRNLERDPRATVLVETGHEYSELRG